MEGGGLMLKFLFVCVRARMYVDDDSQEDPYNRQFHHKAEIFGELVLYAKERLGIGFPPSPRLSYFHVGAARVMGSWRGARLTRLGDKEGKLGCSLHFALWMIWRMQTEYKIFSRQ